MGKVVSEERVLTEKHPKWLDTVVPDSFFDEDLFQILLFYVFYSPCSKFCTQGRTLQHYGWKEKPWNTNRYLKDRLDHNVFQNRKKYFRCSERISELVQDIRKAELEAEFYENRDVERVAFVKVESSEYMSLFHHIRCSLAHGRLAMFPSPHNDVVFIMENGAEKGTQFEVRARLVLRKSTLLQWINIITEGPKEEENNYYREVYQAILDNNTITQKELMRELCESKYAIQKAIEFLKKSKIIEYQKRGSRCWKVEPQKASSCFKNIKVSQKCF